MSLFNAVSAMLEILGMLAAHIKLSCLQRAPMQFKEMLFSL